MNQEFRNLRQFLGLDIEELSLILQINERTIRRYESGSPVNENVFIELKNLAAATLTMVDNSINLIQQKKVEHVNLISYSEKDFAKYNENTLSVLKSTKIHTKILLHTQTYCLVNNIMCTIVTFNADNYFAFLERNNLVDTQENRAQWAGLQTCNE